MALETGDLIQSTDENDPWFGCVLLVTEPKSFGAQAAVVIPESNEPGTQPSLAFRRLWFEKFARVGRSALYPNHEPAPAGEGE